MLEDIAKYINILGDFCGKRDLDFLTRKELENRYGISQADLMVLFGGSILCGGDVLALAMKNKIARRYVIVGGAGHTTEALRAKMHEAFPEIATAGMPEARIFADYLQVRYGFTPDLVECESTNCGNNITNLLALLKHHGIGFDSIILAQDASMQRRMEAGLRKYAKDARLILNYAVYKTPVVVKDGQLAFRDDIWGMWDMERYITLLMGEIPRLTDDETGYGPKGFDYIAHVAIPPDVRNAFNELKKTYPTLVREAVDS